MDVTGDPALAAALGDIASGRPRARRATLRGHPAARSRHGRDSRAAGRPDRRPLAQFVGRVEPSPLPEIAAHDALVAAGAPVEPLLGSLEAVVDGAPLVVAYVVAERDAGEPTFADEAADALDRLLDTAVAEGVPPAAPPLAAAAVLGSGPEPDARVVRELAEIVEAARQVGAAVAGVHDVLARPGGPVPRAVPLDGPPRPLPGMSDAPRRGAGSAPRGRGRPRRRCSGEDDEPADTAALAATVIEARAALDRRLRAIIGRPLDGLRIPRYGGPLTAERVTREGGRYLVGVPGRDVRPAADRTRLQSPLLDVAGILVSLRAIALRPLFGGAAERRTLRPEDARATEGWARAWWAALGSAFVAGYLDALSRPALLPSDTEDRALLLDLLLAELTLQQVLADLRAGDTRRSDGARGPPRPVRRLRGAGAGLTSQPREPAPRRRYALSPRAATSSS